MKAVGGLFEAIADRSNLGRAAWRAARGKLHRPEVRAFFQDLDGQLREMERELREGRYAFAPYRAFQIRDTKSREIHAPPFRDRVAHHALIAVLGPVLERGALEHSYACRAGRGQHAALAQARSWTRRGEWYGKADVEKFYDRVDHDRLRRRLKRRFRERRVLALWEAVLASYETAPGKGLPIGALTSQYLGNFILDEVDHRVKGHGTAPRYLRYMDDMVLWGERATLREARARLEDALGDLELTLKHGGEWNRCERGLPFLGFVIYPDRVRLNRQGRRRLRRKLNELEKRALAGALPPGELADRATSLFAHAATGDDVSWRREVVARSPWTRAGREDLDEAGEEFGDGPEPQAREPRRVLERHRQELPGGEPEQERPARAEPEPGLSRLSGSRHGGRKGPPDGARSRSPSPEGRGDETAEKPPADPEIPGPERGGKNGAAGAPSGGGQLTIDFETP